MKKARNIRWILAAMLLLLLLWGGSQAGFAADRDVEWGCYQNSTENNGVTSVVLPASYEEASLKWGRQLVQGYTTSFTPPLIIDGYLYTASNKHVYKVDRDTGEVLQESDELLLNVSYAMNPITYDEENDQLYVPILKGRIACLNLATLETKWTSKSYNSHQSLSPIAYKDGALYMGTWNKETLDGVFFRLNAETGEEEWTFKPSEHGDLPHGFYWAGAYVNDRYVVVGSDDGTDNMFAESTIGSPYTPTAVVYCFDRETGEVVDRITRVKGDVRCTVVHRDGYIYFVTKGGCLYKARLGQDGKFSQVSSVQLKDVYNGLGVNDAMMTSSPVVWNGRVYVGAAGSGGQFNADGGHMFAVIRDDETLGPASLIYTTQISGYPQAAPILSTAEGKTRLYFTFNAFPGGIYYLEDRADATGNNHPEARLLYRPEVEMQQYCISPLCCDRQGTLYFKNDSGNMMAVAVNKAWLNDLSVQVEDREVVWNTSFEKGTLSYKLKVPDDAQEAEVRLAVPEGMTATVNGTPYTEKMTLPLEDELDPVEVVVKRTVEDREYTRTYTLQMSRATNNANLAGIRITDNNTKPESIVDTAGDTGNNDGVGYDPVFDQDITEYVSRTYDGDKKFLNLWLETADPSAKVRLRPVSNVGNTLHQRLDEDGYIVDSNNDKRFPVYWVKGEISAEVDAEVASESGKITKVYHITLVRGQDYLDVGESPLQSDPASLTLYTKGAEQSGSIKATYEKKDVTKDCRWESTDIAVASVDQEGNVWAGVKGEAEVWLRYGPGQLNTRVHVEVKEPKAKKPVANFKAGTYTRPKVLELSAYSEGTMVRYNIGEKSVEVPDTTTGTVYEAPIPLTGTPGEKVTYLVKAIACGEGYEKSGAETFKFIIDRTGEDPADPPAPCDPPEVEQVTLTDTAAITLPNGTTPGQIRDALAGIKARVTDTNNTENVMNVEWYVSELPYDPQDLRETKMLVHGRAYLPEGVMAGGHTLHVSIPVTIAGGKVAAPELTPGAGVYGGEKLVQLTSATKGASIRYTISGTSGTQDYAVPISMPGEAGKEVDYRIKAYATRSGLQSETIDRVITIDRTGPKLNKVEVKAAGKKIRVQHKTVPEAVQYWAEYRENSKGAWKKVPCKGTVGTLSKLKKNGLYQVRGAVVGADGKTAYTASSYCYIAKTSLKVQAKKKSMKVSGSKVKGATGYRYRYGNASSLKGAKTITVRKPRTTIKKLKSKKVYYVEAAPVKKAGGKTYVGQGVVKKGKVK